MRDVWSTVLLQPLKTLSDHLLRLLPNVLALVLIFSIGLVAAWATGTLVHRVLRVVGLDHLGDRLGITAVLARGGVKAEVSDLAGRIAYWGVALFATIAALSALNLQPINDFAQALLVYLPHLFTAGLIMVAATSCRTSCLKACSSPPSTRACLPPDWWRPVRDGGSN